MSGKNTQMLELRVSDSSEIFIEVEPSEAVPQDRMQKVAKKGHLKAEFADVSGKLADIATSLESQLDKVPVNASGMGLQEVNLELGAKIKSGADLWIVKGDAEAHLKITLKWQRAAG